MLPLQNDGSGRGKARLRKIVARATRTFGFLAYAVFTVNHRAFLRFKSEVELEFTGMRHQLL